MSSASHQQNVFRNLQMHCIRLTKATGSHTRERLIASLTRYAEHHQGDALTPGQFRAKAIDRWADEGGR